MSRNEAYQWLHVEGMSCAQCEAKIESALSALPGVQSVRADAAGKTVRFVRADGAPQVEAIIARIGALGFLASPQAGAKSKTAGRVLLAAGALALCALLIIGNTLGIQLLPEVREGMSLGMLFVVGLITSLHCVAMCGGINLSQCMQGGKEDQAKWHSGALYNLGRVLSYTLIGGAVGALGAVMPLSGAARGAISIAAGVFMLLMGLNLLGLFPSVSKLLPKVRIGQGAMGKAARMGPFFVGLLNGLMPCGPLQSMQIYALGTGSFAMGALSMLLFSLGTVPLMLGMGALSTLLSSRFSRRMMQVGAMLVIALGVMTLSRGLGLANLRGGQSGALELPQTALAEAQHVTSQVYARGYEPLSVKKGIPVVWTLHADARALNGCNDAIIIPEYGIEQALQPGDNRIEFTPTESGTVYFSCWMGMLWSQIEVTEE